MASLGRRPGAAPLTSADIPDDSITGAKIIDNALNSEHYTDGSIDTAHVGANQITAALVAADVATQAEIDLKANSALFMATLSATQTLNANSWTKITLDQEIFDPDGVFGSNKFTVPSTGYYALFGGIRIDTPNGGETCSIRFHKTSGGESEGSFWDGSSEDRRYVNTNGHELFLRISTSPRYLTATDRFELYARSNANDEIASGTTGGTPTGISTYTFMSGYKLIT